MKTLSVLSNGKTHFPNLRSSDADGVSRRFVGWQEKDGKHEPKKDPEEVPAIAEYVRAVRIGDLVPADKQTAELCGVPFTLKQ